MDSRAILCLALMAPLIGAACGEEEPAEEPKTKTTINDIGEEAKDVVGAAEDYATQTKEQLVNELEKQYETLKPRIKELRAKAERMTADARVEVQDQIDALQQEQEAFEKRLTELRAASGDAWKELSQGTENAWSELKTTFDRAWDRLQQADEQQ